MPKAHLFFAVALVLGLAVSHAPGDELDALIQQVEKGNKANKSTEDLSRELLISMTTGPVEKRRTAMWEARIYVDNAPIIKTLINSLQRDPPNLASMAALTLGNMHIKEAAGPLATALASSSMYVRESAAYALGVAGNPDAIPALEKNRPDIPGLSQWIFDDAINALRKGPPMRSARPASVNGSGIFFLGGYDENRLKDDWKTFIDRCKLRVWSTPGSDLNPQMDMFGGPINYRTFTALLADKDGKPQIDVALITDMGPDEFPFELQWQLINFVRRGGSVVMLGESFFNTGQVSNISGKIVRSWSYVPDYWDSFLPRTDNNFRPIRAGMHRPSNLTTGVREVGNGRIVAMRGAEGMQAGTRGWASAFLAAPQYENIIRYAIEGDVGFPALIDLRGGTASAESGKTLAFNATFFSSLGKQVPAELTIDLLSGAQQVATKTWPIDFSGNLATIDAQFPTDWRLPTGDYTASITLRRGDARDTVVGSIHLSSPLQLAWTIVDHYERPGGELTGSAVINSKLTQPVENAVASLELLDPFGRVLQRTSHSLTIKAGKNDPIPLSIFARAYRTDAYPVVFRIEVDGKTVERSQQLICYTRPCLFDQDLVMAPFGGLDPSADKRSHDVMIAAGLNGAASRGTGNPKPGWYSWSYDIAPKVTAKALWPGEVIERMKADEWGRVMREREPGYSVIDHWDEGSTKVLETEGGQDIGGADVFYRNWLKQKYHSLERLNEAWHAHFKAATAANPKAAPEPWETDLTSWNQIRLHEGSPVDWNETENLWWMTLDAERREFQRTNRGHQLWHWSEVIHQRIYISEVPGTLSWQVHSDRAALGNLPSTIMLHSGHPQKGLELFRRFPWNAYIAGARHLSVWAVSLSQSGLFAANPGWTILNGDYTVRDWWKPVAFSLERARARDQVMLDAWNSLSPDVAFLYHGYKGEPPRALFDALNFAGIVPDALQPGVLRSDRMDLAHFKVLFRLGKGELPPAWKDKLDAWQKAGGVILDPLTVNIADYGGRQVDAEVGVKYWVASDQSRLASRQFCDYQTKILAMLAEHGVTPWVRVLDDAGLPAPAVEPALLETHDRSQFYLMTVADSDIQTSQAFGGLDSHAFTEKTDLAGGFYDGAKFKTAGAKTYRVWMLASSDKAFDTRVTVDGKLPIPFRTFEKNEWARTERGLDKPRWIAGPAFNLSEGEHTLKLEHHDVGRPATRVLIVDEPIIEPTIKTNLLGKTTVKAVYDVYNDRMLERVGAPADGLYRAPMRQSDGMIYSLITEDLAPIRIEPRLTQTTSDRLLQVRVDITKNDGTPSACRHSVMLDVTDSLGNPIAHLTAKSSVLGWRVIPVFPAFGDPGLPWKVHIKDLTTGQSAEAAIDAVSSSPAWEVVEASPPIELKTDAEPMPLEGHIHLVPLRVTVVNNGDLPIEGKLQLDVPQDLLLDDEVEKSLHVDKHGSIVVTWPMVLGRSKALSLAVGMTERPPRCVLTLTDGRTREVAVDSLWIRQWEAQPPRLTDMSQTRVDVVVKNFLDKPFTIAVSPTYSPNWEVTSPPPPALQVPAGSSEKPSSVNLTFEARVKPDAPQAPEVYEMPLNVTLAGKTFDAGRMLVDVEKSRTWFVGQQHGMQGVDPVKFEAPTSTDAMDAKKDHLWGLDWQPLRADSLIDFPSEFGKDTIGATNVRFAQGGRVAVRVRGREDVAVWVAGHSMDLGEPHEKPANGKGAAADELNLANEKTLEVAAGKWLPVVVRYRRQSPHPLTDLVFLDESGKVIWSACFRAQVPKE